MADTLEAVHLPGRGVWVRLASAGLADAVMRANTAGFRGGYARIGRENGGFRPLLRSCVLGASWCRGGCATVRRLMMGFLSFISPPPIKNPKRAMKPEIFADLPAPITAALIRRGFEELTPVQLAVVAAASDGRDLRISSQTGSGKTVAIGLALAEHFLKQAGYVPPEPKPEAIAMVVPPEEAEVVVAPGAPGTTDPEAAAGAETITDLAADAVSGAESADASTPEVHIPAIPQSKNPAGATPAAAAPGVAKGYKTYAAPKFPKGARGPRGPKNDRGSKRPKDGAAHPTGLVIVPTRELAAQVSEELAWLYADIADLTVEVVTGGTSVMMERRALSRGPALVVGTPGRLLDHLKNRAIKADEIAHVVLDEADQMLDMGFRDELDAILAEMPPERQSHLVSATFPRAVTQLANRFQNNPMVIEGTRLGEANADIQHIGYGVRRHETFAALVNVLLLAGDERCLLFVNRRVDATDLAEKLARDGFGAAPFSGELAQAQRTRTLASFRNGTLPILVSTEVAARGIDVPGISTVIHVDPPRDPDAYTHRSGRTGRAGLSGRSILFVTPADQNRVKRMLRSAKVDLSFQPVPTPDKVEKALRKRSRKALHDTLASHTPEESQMMYAKGLLEDHDPVQVIATLLDLAKPDSKCKPMPVQGFDPSQERGPQGRDNRESRGDSRGRPDRNRPGHRPTRDSRDNFQSGGRASSNGNRGGSGENYPPIRPPQEAYTRFFVTWGEGSGATTGRLLSQACRRGGIKSDQVGAIEVSDRVSFISVSNDVAAAFEAKASRPDSRDPGIVIKRADEKSAGPSSNPPSKPFFKGGQGGGGSRPGHSPGQAPNHRQGGNPGRPSNARGPSGPRNDNSWKRDGGSAGQQDRAPRNDYRENQSVRPGRGAPRPDRSSGPPNGSRDGAGRPPSGPGGSNGRPTGPRAEGGSPSGPRGGDGGAPRSSSDDQKPRTQGNRKVFRGKLPGRGRP